MITARLKTEDGNVIAEVKLPESLSEMTLNQYVSFNSIVEKEGNAIAVMAEAVQDFTGIDMPAIVQAQVGNVYETADAIDDTLRSLFGHISSTITRHKPRIYSEAEHRFEYKGETYAIPAIKTLPLGLGVVLPNISVIEAIEALELLRLTDASQKERPDEAANIRFTSYLRMLAIIARKEGEELPVNDAQRERFITERVIHFQEIDAATALDVDFFLLSTLQNLNAAHETAGSLIRQASALAVVTQSWSGKRTTVRRRTTRRYSPASAGGK